MTKQLETQITESLQAPSGRMSLRIGYALFAA